jgi:serine/threonine-protein kinase
VAVIIGCIFLVLLANAFGIFNFRKSTTKQQTKETEAVTEQATEKAAVQTVSVPSILGKTEQEAQELLASFGLTGENRGETSSDKYAAGQVCAQSPSSGELVEQGSSVAYKVVEAAAEEEIILSDLSNQEQSQAQAFLLTQGLNCVIDTSRSSDTVDYGNIITTDPAAGASLKAGDTVTLYISQGPQTEAEYVTMRDLYYYSKEVATEALELQGLVPAYEYETNNDGVQEGWVIRTSVAAGEQVAKGTTVTLYISTGPGETTNSDGNITIQNESSGTWQCNASLDTPTGYTGQPVRITLVQNGTETTLFEGTTTFPYRLQVQGASGVSEGTAYVYLLDSASGAVTSKIEYAGINFSQVN